MSSLKVYSAPGKALLVGGYLVLESKYSAYVVALSSRMHAIVEEGSGTSETSQITVMSPQFASEKWVYRAQTNDSNSTFRRVEGETNPFLDSTIEIVLQYLRPQSKFELIITILSDPGYHTQVNATKRRSANGKKVFLYHKDSIQSVPKTGLGSSAGLVSVLTSALYSYLSGHLKKTQVHNLAQISHCYAQKKIGSGFDVAAAVHGSIVYSRFQKELIDPILSSGTNSRNNGNPLVASLELTNLRKIVDKEWSFQHAPCTLPPGIKLLMGDVQGGSETPRLVSTILEWKAKSPVESEKLYTNLDSVNQSFINVLQALENAFRDDQVTYRLALDLLMDTSVNDLLEKKENTTNPILQLFIKLVLSISEIRKLLKGITLISGADIEPHEQTTLLNHCNTLNGCLGGVVPGAGGYDAICLLVVERSVSSIVQKTSLDSHFSQVTWLDLNEQSEGILEENPQDYIGLF